MLQLALTLTLAACGSEQDPAQTASSRESYYKHGTPPGSAPYPYYLTSYGAPGDASFGTPACGGKKVDGTWYYSTGAYTFGCNSKLKLEANGKCVVVEVVDNGPAAWVEAKAAASCGGLGYIIDASPLASKALFGSSSAGWSDCFSIMVTPVPSSTPTGPTSCGSTNPNPTPTPTCGNGKLDAGEKCDSAIPDGQWGSCPTDCDDGNSCTDDFIAGANCQAACGHTYTCTQPTTPVCGNGKLETGEKCDSGIPSGQPGACPTAASCDDGDACTTDTASGSGCQVVCKHTNTCSEPICGNGKVEAGEWCDTAIPAGKPGACPTKADCNDGDVCTDDVLMGSGCLAKCANLPKTNCGQTPPVENPPSSQPNGQSIGGPCTQNSDCASGDCRGAGLGFPGGMCSQACTELCPPGGNGLVTFCMNDMVYVSQFLGAGGGQTGLCVITCDFATYPTAGCRDGYTCVSRTDTATGKASSICIPESKTDGLTEPGAAKPETPSTPNGSGAESGADGGVNGGCAVSGSASVDTLSLVLMLGVAVLLGRGRRGRR